MTFAQMIKELMGFGLSEKESEIYLASVSLGVTTVQNISKKANVNRVTTYAMIDQLTKKGLMSSFAKGKKKLYVAEPPERVMTILQEKEDAARKTIERFTELLPQIQMFSGLSSTKPVVRFYEGVEGIKTIHEMSYRSKAKDFIHVEVAKLSAGLFPPGTSKFRDSNMEKIAKGDRTMKVISVGPCPWREHYYKAGSAHQVKFVSQEKYPLMFEFGVYGDITAIYLQKGDYMGIVIEDDEVARNFRLLFQFMWDHADETYKA